MNKTIGEIISEAEEKLKNISGSPRLDAEILLAKVLKTARFDLFLKYRDQIGEHEKELFGSFLQRRLDREPVAYITNEKEFFEDTFFVDKRVLVPRPETEFIVEEAISLIRQTKNAKVLDICCGSGCIGLSVKRMSGCELTLSDISEDALEVAEINSERLFPGKNGITLVQSDLFGSISGEFDLVTANPPYLSEADMKKFVAGELEKEPRNALYGGKTGFEITKKMIRTAGKVLRPGGHLVTELGYEGSSFLASIECEMQLIKIIKDYSGIDRAAVFRKAAD